MKLNRLNDELVDAFNEIGHDMEVVVVIRESIMAVPGAIQDRNLKCEVSEIELVEEGDETFIRIVVEPS